MFLPRQHMRRLCCSTGAILTEWTRQVSGLGFRVFKPGGQAFLDAFVPKVYSHPNSHLRSWLLECMRAHAHPQIHTCTHDAHTRTRTHTYARTRTYTHAPTHTRTHARTHTVSLNLSVLLLAANGITTWVYGYHSLQQIVFGAVLVCAPTHTPNKKHRHRRARLGAYTHAYAHVYTFAHTQ